MLILRAIVSLFWALDSCGRIGLLRVNFQSFSRYWALLAHSFFNCSGLIGKIWSEILTKKHRGSLTYFFFFFAHWKQLGSKEFTE